MQKLTALDYITMPITDLSTHQNFSQKAFLVVLALSKMTTQELEALDIPGVTQ